MTEKTPFRKHIVPDPGVCPRGIVSHRTRGRLGRVGRGTRGASAEANPFRFSSEYAEDDTATVYYNYRHYEPGMGRWMRRDPMSEHGGHRLYSFSTRMSIDVLGLKEVSISGFADTDDWSENWSIALAWRFHSVGKDIVFRSIDVLMRNIDVEVGECDCIKYFQITAHGSSSRVDEPDGTSDSVAIHMGKDLYLFKDEKDYEISGLFDGVKGKFCKRCEIVLRSCYLGQSPWLEDRIRKETGCDVKLFKWSVNPILGNDWIEMFAREAPRVPTIGMPGMLPL